MVPLSTFLRNSPEFESSQRLHVWKTWICSQDFITLLKHRIMAMSKYLLENYRESRAWGDWEKHSPGMLDEVHSTEWMVTALETGLRLSFLPLPSNESAEKEKNFASVFWGRQTAFRSMWVRKTQKFEFMKFHPGYIFHCFWVNMLKWWKRSLCMFVYPVLTMLGLWGFCFILFFSLLSP